MQCVDVYVRATLAACEVDGSKKRQLGGGNDNNNLFRLVRVGLVGRTS